MAPNRRVALLSLVLTLAAVLCTFVGGIPLISVLLVIAAPLVFLIGLSGLIASLIPTRRTWVRVLTFVLLLPIIGLNTRIPVMFQPLARSVSAYPPGAMELTSESWVQLEVEDEELSARLRPLSGPEPRCKHDGCFVFDGFRMPKPHVHDEYWWESPEESLLQKGVSLSGVGAPKAYLRVVTEPSGVRRQIVRIELLDAGRRRLGHATEEFRTGLPSEPLDGGDASGLDFLLHANPIARFAARLVENSKPYPVHRFIDQSFVVKNENANGIRAITLDIDVNEPVPAHSVERSGDPLEAMFASHTKNHGKCATVFARRILSERMHSAVLYSDSSARKSQLPIIFARDRAGNLIGFETAQTVAVRCDDESIYSMTDTVSPLAVMRIVRYDHRGVANVSITAAVKNPRNSLSYVDLESLKFSGNDVAFTRWYWTLHPLAFAQRQDIRLILPN